MGELAVELKSELIKAQRSSDTQRIQFLKGQIESIAKYLPQNSRMTTR